MTSDMEERGVGPYAVWGRDPKTLWHIPLGTVDAADILSATEVAEKEWPGENIATLRLSDMSEDARAVFLGGLAMGRQGPEGTVRDAPGL